MIQKIIEQKRRNIKKIGRENCSIKFNSTRRMLKLEPMNPYERRIIHSALQNDKFVNTYSEGDEPNRRVVIDLKKA